MEIKAFFDEDTFTLTYVVWDAETKDAIVIDPVLDYDPKASQTSTDSVDEVLDFVADNKLNVHYVMETHAHADHVTGAQVLRERLGAKVVIGEHIVAVQETFKTVFNLPEDFKTDGSQFDLLAKEGTPIEAGTLKIDVIHTPGHTPACVSFLIEDALFSGDALLIDDFGVGRCDFPKGSAEDLYHSVHEKLYKLPAETRVFVGHDYPEGRALRYETTIGASMEKNPQLRGDTSKEDFIKMRTERDATLAAPRLLLQSVQLNVSNGRLPGEAKNGIRYLNIPVNMFGPTDEVGLPKS